MKITIIGDIAFTGLLSYEPHENPRRFHSVLPILESSELVFANLEVPIKAYDDQNEYKNFIHYTLEEPTTKLLDLLNIGCVSLANNHVFDSKMSGLKTTIGVLNKLQIPHTGAGWEKEHIEPVIIEKNETKIGFLAYVDRSTNPKTENFKDLYINYLIPGKVINDIKRLKTKVDKVILSLHWGQDYSYYPLKKQRDIGQSFVDAGADIIMGHHPHTLQPFEYYKESLIFYSLGGLTFGDYYRKDGKIQALYRKTKKGLITNYNIQTEELSFVTTKEKPGNFIKVLNRDFFKWNKKMWFLYKIKNSNLIFYRSFHFKESFIDRVYEYFFGYYQNPIKRLFQFKNIIKIKRLFN